MSESLPRVTDPDSYRALCQSLVECENAENLERAEVLRAMVDAAAFGECPDCQDDDREGRRMDCQTCGGDGFVPDNCEVSGVALTLDNFVEEVKVDIEAFAADYRKQHLANPEQFPLELGADNAGLWTEFFMDFMTRER